MHFGEFPWGFPGKGFGFGASAGRRPRFFDSGEVRLAILSLLREGPKHGYQLMKELSERSGGVYKASAGSVYPTLQQLEDEELVEMKKDEGRRVYQLTALGRKELDKDPEAERRIWMRAESWDDWGQCVGPEAYVIWGPLGKVIRAAMRAQTRARHRDVNERVMAILDRARRELEDLTR